MKKTHRKLQLRRESIRSLTGIALDGVRGAGKCTMGSGCTVVDPPGPETEPPGSVYVTQCAGLCTTNPWTQNCPVTQ